MKKILAILMVLSFCGAVIAGSFATNGWGKKYTASTTAQRILFSDYSDQFDKRPKMIVLHNAGTASQELYYQVNTTTGAFNTIVASTNAMVIPGQSAITINLDFTVESLVFSAASGTFTIYVSAL